MNSKPHLIRATWKIPGTVTVKFIQNEGSEEENPYILQEDAYESDVYITIGTIELTRYADTLKTILEFHKPADRIIQEIQADFIQEKSQKIYFLKINDIKYLENRRLGTAKSEILQKNSSNISPKGNLLDVLSFTSYQKNETSPHSISTRPHTHFRISRVKFRQNNAIGEIPYLKSRNRQKELELDVNIKELIGKPRNKGLRYITYKSWHGRVQKNARITPIDLLYASKIATHSKFVKQKCDSNKIQLKGLIDTMTKMTSDKSSEPNLNSKNKEGTPNEINKFSIISRDDLRRKLTNLTYKETKEELDNGAKRIDEILRRIEKNSY